MPEPQHLPRVASFPPSAAERHGRREDVGSRATALLAGALIFSALYQAYRYPLQISDSSVSDTYRDTPLALQAAKYAVLGGAAAVLLGLMPRGAIRRLAAPEVLLASFAAYLAVRGAAAAAAGEGSDALNIIAPIVIGVPIALAAGNLMHDPRLRMHVGRLFFALAAAVVVGHTLANVAQVALWKWHGRLPALTLEAGTPRFGGFWDDPNSCAAFSAAFAIAVVGARRRWAPGRWLLLLGCAVAFNLIVAWSYSGWLLFGSGLALLALLRRRFVVAVGLVAVTFLALVLAHNPASLHDVPVVGAQLESKTYSARSRLDVGTHFVDPGSALAWVIGSPDLLSPDVSDPDEHGIENTLGGLLAMGGAVAVLLFLLWLALALGRIAKESRLDWAVAVAIAFVVSSLFVPFPTTFPLGVFFVVGVTLASTAATSFDVRGAAEHPADPGARTGSEIFLRGLLPRATAVAAATAVVVVAAALAVAEERPAALRPTHLGIVPAVSPGVAVTVDRASRDGPTIVWTATRAGATRTRLSRYTSGDTSGEGAERGPLSIVLPVGLPRLLAVDDSRPLTVAVFHGTGARSAVTIFRVRDVNGGVAAGAIARLPVPRAIRILSIALATRPHGLPDLVLAADGAGLTSGVYRISGAARYEVEPARLTLAGIDVSRIVSATLAPVEGPEDDLVVVTRAADGWLLSFVRQEDGVRSAKGFTAPASSRFSIGAMDGRATIFGITSQAAKTAVDAFPLHVRCRERGDPCEIGT
jgi:hypothetical protein